MFVSEKEISAKGIDFGLIDKLKKNIGFLKLQFTDPCNTVKLWLSFCLW